MFHFLIPKSLTSFICYGILPLLFYKLGMTGKDDELIDSKSLEISKEELKTA